MIGRMAGFFLFKRAGAWSQWNMVMFASYGWWTKSCTTWITYAKVPSRSPFNIGSWNMGRKKKVECPKSCTTLPKHKDNIEHGGEGLATNLWSQPLLEGGAGFRPSTVCRIWGHTRCADRKILCCLEGFRLRVLLRFGLAGGVVGMGWVWASRWLWRLGTVDGPVFWAKHFKIVGFF